LPDSASAGVSTDASTNASALKSSMGTSIDGVSLSSTVCGCGIGVQNIK
jgi:hypothetical protein